MIRQKWLNMGSITIVSDDNEVLRKIHGRRNIKAENGKRSMVGMLTIFSLIAGSLQESGFIAALANKKEITHDDYNAVFWFSITVSFCLYWILFFCAPLIADFYNQPELIPLARYSFLGFFIASGLGNCFSLDLFRYDRCPAGL